MSNIAIVADTRELNELPADVLHGALILDSRPLPSVIRLKHFNARKRRIF